MSVTEISVKRPATIIVVMILLIGLGILGYSRMGADLFPSVNIPVITVTTTYPGAGAEEIKKDVVKPIEDAISGISGLDQLNSSAREGVGQTIIVFTMETDMNSAFADVQKAVESASSRLPKNANRPVLFKIDPGENAVVTLSVSGTRSYEEIYNQADKIKSKIEKINDVGKVSLQGGIQKELRIKADKTALEFYGISINTILNKIRAENTNVPAGQIKDEESNQSIKVVSEFSDLNEVRNLSIPTKGGGAVRLFEIAALSIEYPEEEQYIRLNGKNSIGINIQKQSDANVVEVVNRIKKDVEEIQKTLPEGITVTVADDTTIFIKRSLSEIQRNLLEGIITTAVVLFLFMRSLRASIIVLVAIPTSLIATFFMMYLLDFTLNMMSLLALSLCIGILVDDSIVVLENIQRHLAMGKNPIAAAIEGRKEIGMAAVAITLSDVVVFAPVAFMSGMIGQFFKEFGLTVVFATLFSLFVSFTITPMLASRFLKKEAGHTPDGPEGGEPDPNKKLTRVEKMMQNFRQGYLQLLNWSLAHRWTVIFLVIGAFIFSIALVPLKFIATEFVPQTDQSRFVIDMKLSPGTTLKSTDKEVRRVEEYLRTLPEVMDFYSTVGNGNDAAVASIIVKLKPIKEREKSQGEVAISVRQWGKQLPGMSFSVNESQTGGGGTGNPVQINLSGSESLLLNEVSMKVEEMLQTIPGIIDVSNSSKAKDSEIRVNVDRLAANEYGLSVTEISGILRTALQGTNAGVYRANGNEFDITVMFMENQVKSVEDIGAIKIPNTQGNLIPINQVAFVQRADAQQSISRMDRQDVVRITANIQGKSLGIINAEISEKFKDFKAQGVSISYGGSQRQMADAIMPLVGAFFASIVLIYLILVVLYESFTTPLIRMLALPTGIIGALLMLALTGKSLNMMSMIGLIMLDGLASKNGTLLIDYTHTLMKKGLSLRDALLEAGTTRLRPIIMTSVTMIVGMLPAALALGEGAETKSSMALVIIGGMIVSTLVTPILLPVVYTLMEDVKLRIFKRRKKEILQEVAHDAI